MDIQGVEIDLGTRQLPFRNPARGGYLADAGFAGRKNIEGWKNYYGALVIWEAGANTTPWPAAWRAWLHPLRQVIELVFAMLFIFSAWALTARIHWMAFKPIGRPISPCTTSVSGSTIRWIARLSPSRTFSTANRPFHTKR